MIKMTDDEAILHLTYMTIPKIYKMTEKDKVALNMAMEALDERKKNREDFEKLLWEVREV